MKLNITYATRCSLTLHYADHPYLKSAEWKEECDTLAQAIDTAEFILNVLYPLSVESVMIWDSATGEILATCDQEP